jgi:membrane-bound lytic murein transglycosylase A
MVMCRKPTGRLCRIPSRFRLSDHTGTCDKGRASPFLLFAEVFMHRFLSLLLILLVAGCAGTIKESPKTDKKTLILKPSSFGQIDSWANDDLTGFMEAYRKSCARILKKNPDEKFSANPAFGTYAPWQENCRQGNQISATNDAAIRQFIERNFKVVQATGDGDPEGLFTGYYVSSLTGSRHRHGPYQYPLLARPDDLVMVDLGEFREELKGQRIAGRVLDGKLKPYENRAAIVAGKLPSGKEKPLVWLDDPHDAFFVQVQGSGNVQLDDGSIVRVGYDGQNGHPYYAIGRELVKRGIYSKDDVSMESIRHWLENNPDQANDLMNTNPSYVFFREMPDDGKGGGAQGGEGITLTPLRSLAIDRSILPYGMPVFLSTDYTDHNGRPLKRLLMTQDTGGAIVGAVRGDVFWGSGAQAEAKAGPMKASGRYWFLLPKGL